MFRKFLCVIGFHTDVRLHLDLNSLTGSYHRCHVCGHETPIEHDYEQDLGVIYNED